jgi:amino acid efflux transporter
VKWPSTVFVFDYVLVMAAALKLLPRSDLAWWLALLSLITCAVVWAFSGWVAVFPLVLAAAGLIYSNIARGVRRGQE